MLLIATDEAGYGPRLGPLVIAATAWRVPEATSDESRLESIFQPMRTPRRCDHSTVTIDDSKVVYRSGAGFSSLHAAVSASHHWYGRCESTLPAILPHLASEDHASIKATDWLKQLGDDRFVQKSATQEIRLAWGASGISQLDTKVRIITAARLNHYCDGTSNKADLLSESTVRLVRNLLEKHCGESRVVSVHCDRHGGRRYYAAVLQHVFPEARVRVITESNKQSVYQLAVPSPQQSELEVTIHFTVKGDTFTPVAFSSIHAKYLRERFMQSFNRYFAALYEGTEPLRPTAGYPVDADRFIQQIATTIQGQDIPLDKLVRSR